MKKKLLKRTTINSDTNILNLWWGIKKIHFGNLGGNNIRLIPASFFGHSENIFIENNVYMAQNAYLDAISSITIREGVMIGPRCTMIAGNHNYKSADLRSVPYDNRMADTPIVIDKNVWIGANVTVCPGTHIGEGAVIGAGCCVHGIIPAYAIIVPSNYRIIGYRDEQQYRKLAEKHLVYNELYCGSSFELVEKDNL